MHNKIAVVTAAGQGIGRACAERLAREGAKVYALDINRDGLSSLTDMETRTIDCTQEQALGAFFSDLERVDIMVHGVGYVHNGTIEECSTQEWQKSINITLNSAFFTLREAIPRMKAHGGSIINIASIASSIKGFPNRAAYGAAKGGVIGLTKSIAVDYLADGIRCNAICPGTTQSPSLDERIEALSAKSGGLEEARKAFVARQPMGRLGTPEEMAGLCAYLASDESSFVTGQCYHIDGGTTI